MTTRFWLIRHGEPAGEVRQRCYGSLDVGLSTQGRARMRRLAEHLRTESVAAIYSSPRLRAIETAQILSALASRPIEIAPDLREIHFGSFEGLSYEEIAAQYPELYRHWMETPTQVRFPNGETFSEMRSRVLSAFEALRREREGQTIAVVSHGGVNRILLAWALQIPDDCLFRLAQDYGALNLLTIVDGFPMVELVNYSAAWGNSDNA